MNKQLKALIILLFILVLLALLYFFLSPDTTSDTEAKDKTGEKTEMSYITDSKAEDIQAITCTHKNGTALTFIKKDGGWIYADDESAPLNSALIDDMADQLCRIPIIRDISDAAGDKELYGLKQPELIVAAEYKNSRREYIIGDYNSSSGGYYIEYEGKIYIADTNIASVCSKPLFEYLSVLWLPYIDAESVDSITLNGELVESYEINGVMQAYEELTVKGVENYKNKELYGFDDNSHELVISYDQNESFKLKISFLNDNTYVMMKDEAVIYFAQSSQKLKELVTK